MVEATFALFARYHGDGGKITPALVGCNPRWSVVSMAAAPMEGPLRAPGRPNTGTRGLPSPPVWYPAARRPARTADEGRQHLDQVSSTVRIRRELCRPPSNR